MDAVKFCPFCGCDRITYYDDDYPIYGFCPKCKKWVAGSSGFEEREVRYIIDKLKMISHIAKNMEGMKNEVLQDSTDHAH